VKRTVRGRQSRYSTRFFTTLFTFFFTPFFTVFATLMFTPVEFLGLALNSLTSPAWRLLLDHPDLDFRPHVGVQADRDPVHAE
jgi:hypothetical protein